MGEIFYYLTYQDKKFKIWREGLSVYRQKMIYHMRTKMQQSLHVCVFSLYACFYCIVKKQKRWVFYNNFQMLWVLIRTTLSQQF